VDHGGGNDLDGRADGRLLGDAQWRRILTDPHSGLVTDYGTTRYRPPNSLGDYVRARDGRCYEPLCQRSAWAGDLDHIRNSPAGPSPRPHPDGATSAANLGAGCRRGHGAKAAPGWSVEAPTEGRFIWTTPTGHTHTREPEPPLDWWNHTWTTSQPEEKAETGVETEFDRMAQSRAEPESAADAESEAEPDSAAQAESETGLESEALPDIGTVRDIGAEEGHTSAAASQADQALSARQPLEDQPPPF
jgi:hypothetical protein